jgi:ABC-type bacteriocin/lantibiotic exporter with double-glycine peptidase domain
MSLLELPVHIQQVDIGYCLPACAQMALAQLGITAPQMRLAQVLGTRKGVGTVFSRIEQLAQWHVSVQLKRLASPDDVVVALTDSKAVIAAIMTTPGLTGWNNIRTQHAVLITKVTADQITYHDPVLAYGPVSALLAEFLLAWGEMDQRMALLSRG